MKVFKSNSKNYLYFLYRIANPFFDPVRMYNGLIGYVWFIRDIVIFKKMDSSAHIINRNLFPILHEKTKYTSFDVQNYYQQLWAFEDILKRKPRLHVDVGSTYLFNGYVSKITKTVFIDIRPIKTSLSNLEVKKGSILNLPIPDNSVKSLSSLCVAGHIGLGRYGDEIDPQGTKKACNELSRVLSQGGNLYFSTTIGKERICFNAHRVYSPLTILEYFKNLKLVEFSVVDDNGVYRQNVDHRKYSNLNYGGGFFIFTKEKQR